jgi:hypothetical protein
MDPITLTLLGASLAGGIIKAFSGKKVIDPNWLKQHFGAAVVNQEMIDLFNHAISSPQGQRIMTSAAEQGAQFGQDTQRAAAKAGLGAGGGAASGTGIFATSASEGATNSFQREGRAQLFEQGRSTAQDIVNNRMAAYMNSYNNTPTTGEKIGDALGGAAGTALSFYTPAAKVAPTSSVSKFAQLGAGRLVAPTGPTFAPPQTMLQTDKVNAINGTGRYGRFA